MAIALSSIGYTRFKKFDLNLLIILFQNIPGLPSPATGWNVMPAASDKSRSANIARIKILRNEVYGHAPSAQLDDTKFETFWQEISKSLVSLGIPQHDIDKLKVAPLSPEEESYIEELKELKEQKRDLLSKLAVHEKDDVKNKVTKLDSTGNSNAGIVSFSECKSFFFIFMFSKI